MSSRLVLLGLLCCALSAQAEISKWVDAQGRTHYGDRPPAERQAKAASLRGTVSVGEGVTPLPAEPRKQESSASEQFAAAIAQPRKGEVWIYTTASCGYCKQAKAHMQQRGIAFLEKDVGASAAYKAEFRAMGGRGVPVTLSGSQRINGYSVEAFDAFLRSAGF